MAHTVKKSACHEGDPGSVPGLGRSLEKGMAAHSSILGEFHGQRNLAGYSPWGQKESDRAKQLTLSLSHDNIVRDIDKFIVFYQDCL